MGEYPFYKKFGSRFNGEVALWFGFLYFFGRFWIEFFRSGRNVYFGLNIVQWVCLVLMGYVFLLIVINYSISIISGISNKKKFSEFWINKKFGYDLLKQIRFIIQNKKEIFK